MSAPRLAAMAAVALLVSAAPEAEARDCAEVGRCGVPADHSLLQAAANIHSSQKWNRAEKGKERKRTETAPVPHHSEPSELIESGWDKEYITQNEHCKWDGDSLTHPKCYPPRYCEWAWKFGDLGYDRPCRLRDNPLPPASDAECLFSTKRWVCDESRFCIRIRSDACSILHDPEASVQGYDAKSKAEVAAARAACCRLKTPEELVVPSTCTADGQDTGQACLGIPLSGGKGAFCRGAYAQADCEGFYQDMGGGEFRQCHWLAKGSDLAHTLAFKKGVLAESFLGCIPAFNAMGDQQCCTP